MKSIKIEKVYAVDGKTFPTWNEASSYLATKRREQARQDFENDLDQLVRNTGVTDVRDIDFTAIARLLRERGIITPKTARVPKLDE